MDDIDIRILDEVAEIVVCGNSLVEFVFRHAHGLVEVAAVDIADGREAATLVACEMTFRAPYASDADNAFCELVAGGDIAVAAQHMAWNDCEQAGEAYGLEKCASVG